MILNFNCENTELDQQDLRSILAINEFGRRTYPQFLSEDECGKFTKSVKEAFHPSKIILSLGYGEGSIFEEDFIFFDDKSSDYTRQSKADGFVKRQQHLLPAPKYIKELLPSSFAFTKQEAAADCAEVRLLRIMDDRMFFNCWYDNPYEINCLKEITAKSNSIVQYGYETSKTWYAYIFGDKDPNSPSLQNVNMMRDHLAKHSYARWIEWGTLYGMSRDSMVCMTSNFSLSRDHMQSMYYQFSVLCLAQRASILKFSAEVTDLSKELNLLMAKRQDKREIILQIQQLHLNYVEFIGRLYFREVSSQIQGIEMYSQLQAVMNIERDMKDLDSEIQELHNVVMLIEQRDMNEKQEQLNQNQEKLNKIVIYGLPFTIVFGILGANIYDESNKFSISFNLHAISWIVIGSAISILLIWVIKEKIFNNDN